jgi:hypothetical protein
MKVPFLSSEQRARLHGFAVQSKESYRQASMTQDEGIRTMCRLVAAEAEFDFWALLRSHLYRASSHNCLKEILAELQKIFPNLDFALNHNDGFESQKAAFALYLGKRHSDVSVLVHELRLA